MLPLEPSDPHRVGRFQVLGRLGEGGMGRVYLGRTPEGQQAAVKVIRDDLAGDTAFRRRFRREVAAAVAVAGMFTARVLDADPDADPPWLATQFVDGPSLRELVDRHGPLDERALLQLALGLAEALSAIHAAGLVHRDLKPANVLLAADGAKVIDFGIAQTSGATQLTGTGQMIGTPEYMSPEQVEAHGPPGPASDLFAMASTLAYAATGRSPFAAGHTAASLYRIIEGEPDLRGVPPRLDGLLRACLSKDPARRPAAPQVAAWLRAGTTAPVPAHARTTVPPTSAPPTSGRRRWGLVVAVAAIGVALVLAGVTVLALTTSSGGDAPPSALPTPTPSVDPDGPEARYVDRLCKSGDLLVSLGDTTTLPVVTDDPAVTRREFLAGADRAIGVVDAALADYTVLRDDAPNSEVAAGFQLVIDEFTIAREAFVDARDQVEASDPLTATAYATAVERFTDGLRNLALVSSILEGITLPDSYTDAGEIDPDCDP